ncbi:MAG: bifunctional diaminohydroxyphosphoribosylaminopyrimidine deaminase/5-amino-6-(5-phosphoribosylamino)uracil reductase RibD [SAR202 cluster bacterium]|nr:bifunctional diaminohydroxyphosphoribosylaminopyrimidine deaminase/5-amino-6-(5-phosphoribosylamino)uracil reductase RibD [SAR202 cluster bacterium]|tara:strand:+ start:5680 stop:6780 length:1101 start_codon:yes stop_codon:yes gene_type:complete
MESSVPYLSRAVDLAQRAVGRVSPNPAVGAVIVREDIIVGEGFTQPPGGSHAEIVALERAGDAAVDATLYVTLEPCSHYGRTPPCTQAIVKSGVKEVHFSALDLAPWSSGKGIEELEQAGIRTVIHGDHQPSIDLNAAYVKFASHGMPWVLAKYAMSIDGKIATRTGDSRWITGEESRARVHEIRASSDAVMVGIGTVLADDPELTARPETKFAFEEQPLRVVVDSEGRIPSDAKMFQNRAPVLIAVANQDAAQRLSKKLDQDVTILVMPGSDNRVSVRNLLAALAERDVVNLMVEGGGTLLGALFDEDLVDEVIGCIAPVIVGGANAPSPVRGAGVEMLADANRMQRVRIESVGSDVWFMGFIAR